MSNFLVNLARCGAGLPATTLQAPPPSPFGPEIRKHGDESTEQLAAENVTRQAPLRASFLEESTEPPVEASMHHTPSIQRSSGTESSRPIQAAVGAPAPRQHAIPDGREARVAPLEPPNPLDPAASPVHTGHEVITEIDIEHGHPSSAARTIEPAGEPAPQVIGRASGPPIIIRETGERQVISPAQLSAEPPRIGARKTPKSALTAPTIRPAPAESHTLLQVPKATPAASPTPPAQLPIHVRIGRVEVRATAAPTPTPASPSPPAPLGFDGYYRLRTYRS